MRKVFQSEPSVLIFLKEDFKTTKNLGSHQKAPFQTLNFKIIFGFKRVLNESSRFTDSENDLLFEIGQKFVEISKSKYFKLCFSDFQILCQKDFESTSKSLIRNWAGLSYLSQGRSFSELLAIFCCNLEDEFLLDSLLSLLFDAFDVFLPENDKDDQLINEDQTSFFEKLVSNTQQLLPDESEEFSLDKSFIAQEAKRKIRKEPSEGISFIFLNKD